MGIAAVDQDVAVVEMRQDLLDEVVDRLAGLHHQHDLARARQRRDEFRNAVAADDVLPAAAAVDELVDPAHGAVEARDREPLAFHVQDEVLPHHRQPDQSDVRLLHDPQVSRAGAARGAMATGA